MPSAKISTKELEKQIKERKKLIMRFVRFTEKITREVGILVHTDSGSGLIAHIIRELRDFNGFSFLSDTGCTMFGCYDFKIWYHPDKVEIVLQQTKPVLHVYYQSDLDDKHATVDFNPLPAWQSALNYLVTNKKKAISAFKRKEEENDEKFYREEFEHERREELKKEARKLGIDLTKSDFGDKSRAK